VLNRRSLIAAIGASTAWTMTSPLLAKETNPMASKRGVAPPHATDCHAHIFDPTRFPYSSARRYTPPPATVPELLRMHDSIGIERVVLVQPSVYGTNNECLLDALKQLGERARGVAVINSTFSRTQLEDMHGAGVRGVRINLEVSKDSDTSDALRRLRATVDTLGDAPMLIQVYAALPVILACGPMLRGMRQQVLIDHFGLAKTNQGTGNQDFAALLDLMKSPNVWMKLSGPYQISDATPAYADIAPIAKALISASPRRVVWGSDWPHTGGSNRPADYKPTDLEPFRKEDDQRNFGLVWDWTAQAAMRHRLLVDNPERLYGFDPYHQ